MSAKGYKSGILHRSLGLVTSCVAAGFRRAGSPRCGTRLPSSQECHSETPNPCGGDVPANNGSWWGTFGRTFVNGVIHGVRQPGQSFGQCVLQNANTTTGGTHGLILGAAIAAGLAWKSNNSSVGQPIGPGLPGLSPTFYISVYAASLSPALGSAVSSTFTVAGEAAPYLAAGEAGLLIGSAINCR